MSSVPGPAWLFPFNVDATSVGNPVQVIDFEIERKLNEIGRFRITVPASVSWALRVKRGWRFSLVQDGNVPDNGAGSDYLLYLGYLIDHEFTTNEAGTAVLMLSGGLRTFKLQTRQTNHWVWDNPASDIIGDLIDTDQIMGSPSSITTPTYSANYKITFDDLSRYAALLRMAEYLRANIRDNWDYDGIEFVQYDDVPNSGYTFRAFDHIDPEHASEQAELGYGIIAGTPRFRVKGQNVVNRLKAIGVDTVGTDTPPLTLQGATGGPYAVQSATEHSDTFYYIEDVTSQALYGLVEMPYQRTDIRNPSDDAGTRTASRNALLAVTQNELLRRRSAYLEFEIEIANGPDIWSLPGDAVRLDYDGDVIVSGGGVIWLAYHGYVLITGRVDASGEGGTRRVSFTVVAPQIAVVNPDLPDAIIIPPPPESSPAPNAPQFEEPEPDKPSDPGGIPSGPEIPGGTVENCCPDSTTEVNDGPEPPDPALEVDLPDPEGDIPFGGSPISLSYFSSTADRTVGASNFALIYMSKVGADPTISTVSGSPEVRLIGPVLIKNGSHLQFALVLGDGVVGFDASTVYGYTGGVPGGGTPSISYSSVGGATVAGGGGGTLTLPLSGSPLGSGAVAALVTGSVGGPDFLAVQPDIETNGGTAAFPNGAWSNSAMDVTWDGVDGGTPGTDYYIYGVICRIGK